MATLINQSKFKRGDVVYAAEGISRGNAVICLTEDGSKGKINYIPVGTIGLILSNSNRRNVRIFWANGIQGWVNGDSVRMLGG